MSNNMSRKRTNGQLIGINLLPDSYVPQCQNTHQLTNGKIIGTLYVPIEGTTCAYLRRSISVSLDAPKEYRFYNAAGWPFDTIYEDKILLSDCLVSNVVTIQHHHGKKTRIGIRVPSGHSLGFIFLNFGYEVSRIRDIIAAELSDQFDTDETFEFIENNSWPVRKNQESSLSVWDLVLNNCITIVKKKIKRNFKSEDDLSEKRSKLKKKPMLEITSKNDELNSHSILISYVHGEATTYAQDLKKELLKMGFKRIFLDIDDIPAGHDWQDVISLALNNCSIFVPLVTRRYGETRWTNREAKLADDREKIIIPISFLDKWPPDPLAIQFVSLQYIPWKTADEINGGSSSGYYETEWHIQSVKRVAKEIKKHCTEHDVSTPDSASLLDIQEFLRKRDRKNHTLRSTDFSLKLNDKQKNHYDNNQKNLIVISAHAKEKHFVKKVTKMLVGCGYSVWCSMNMCECDENAFSPLEDTQPLVGTSLTECNSLPLTPVNEEKMFPGSNDLSLSDIKQLKRDFKCKVKQAKLVVLIFSEDYLRSRICKQQLFYCEQRKAAIVIKHGDFEIDSIILNLYPEHEMISGENWESLKFKIKEKLRFDTDDSYRNNIMLSVSKLKNVINTDLTVYVIGGTENISKNAESFCLVLGTELAKVKNLFLATEGFNGVGDLVGKNFCEEQEIRDKGRPPNVYHIIPIKDSSDYSHKARQRSDGSFEKLPYGNTLYYGISVANRDDIVAAAFKLCILVEGGERSACLAEKFLWNDCTVIPVLYNNKAIHNKQCLSESITKVPNGVSENDWQNLNRQNISPEDRARSVKKIVCALLNLNN